MIYKYQRIIPYNQLILRIEILKVSALFNILQKKKKKNTNPAGIVKNASFLLHAKNHFIELYNKNEPVVLSRTKDIR